MNLKGNYHVCKSSAGSGKTFTLAKFYLSLILKNPSQDYFRHILAITFTVKAAAEMKNRIIHYLSGFASKGRLSPDHLLMLDLISKE
jgi:ATP-dependent helicase/nuclease subunit A